MNIDATSVRSLPIGAVLDSLASSRPDWGGGTAVLLGAAMGTCLLAMSARVALAGVESGKFTPPVLSAAELGEMGDRLAKYADELACWAALDGSLYGRVVEAQRLPKDNPEVRSAAIEKALRGAIEGPLQVAELIGEVFGLAEILVSNCKKANLSDISSGVHMLLQGSRGALLNVRQNCGQRPVFADYLEQATRIEHENNFRAEIIQSRC